MGMYTKLHCNIPLKKDSQKCIEILQNMLGEKDDINLQSLEHELFKCGRSSFMLNANSFYFTGTSNSNLLKNGSNYVLHCDFDMKNYKCEIELFLDWISQYCDDTNKLLGYEIYEENELPNLLYYKNGKIKKIYIIKDNENEN